ncbi:DUF2321 domain-containing protein [Paenibacillus sp. 1011MAR3C5]|uniref:DUF2321 domain-containing protein n=1 Tax=Paenibacillus sp. 1011MAR3C5 TaxID=1675787 RepID=UPI0016020F66|nr:DUF2321 domain-containing protein [Paenibacillus sp. 1011MAR3C5]
MGYYEVSTICRNGHFITSARQQHSDKFCRSCGVPNISSCQQCNTPIRGKYRSDGILDLTSYDYVPAYCPTCSEAYPWTEKLLSNAVELISLDEKLSPQHKELIKLAMPDLIVETPSSPVAVAKYKKYMATASDFIKDGMRNLLYDVVSETVKKSIWG